MSRRRWEGEDGLELRAAMIVAMNDAEGWLGPLGRNGCWSESYTAYGVGNPAQRARGWVRAESVPYPPQHDVRHIVKMR